MFSKDTEWTIFTLFVILDTNGKTHRSLGLVHIIYLPNPNTLAANTPLHETLELAIYSQDYPCLMFFLTVPNLCGGEYIYTMIW